jgi:predicted PurR-regulated permease PerM
VSIGLPRNDPGRFSQEGWKAHAARTAARRTKVAQESWRDFFRTFAIQMGIVAGIAVVITIVFWLMGR